MASRRKDRLTPEVLEREGRVVELKNQGLSFDAIAVELGYSNRGAANKAYWRALERFPAEKVEETREIENLKLDEKEAIADDLLEAAIRADDPDMVVKGLNSWRGLAERRAKLNGLDLPVKQELEMSGAGAFPVRLNMDRLPRATREALEREQGVSGGEDDG